MIKITKANVTIDRLRKQLEILITADIVPELCLKLALLLEGLSPDFCIEAPVDKHVVRISLNKSIKQYRSQLIVRQHQCDLECSENEIRYWYCHRAH